MPRKRRRLKERQPAVDWDALFEQIEQGRPWRRGEIGAGRLDPRLYQLVHGYDFFGAAFGEDDRRGCRPFDEASARGFWDVLRDAILEKHVEHAPGTRPWAWWRLEARGPLDLLAGHLETTRPPWLGDGPIRWPRDFHFGRPKVVSGWAEYEDEFDYLKRRRLLVAGESRRFHEMHEEQR